MIVILNYGVGNLESVANMLKKAGVKSLITNEVNDIERAEKIILPGVGHFGHCMQKLKESGLLPMLEQKALMDRIPVLGICVGHQMLFDRSEEGNSEGLGWIKGEVVKFRTEMLPTNYKIPHMGWSEVAVTRPSRLMDNIADPRFYFVHSYHAKVVNADDAILTANYGHPFVVGIEHENIVGVQFHPEKSHSFGMRLLENFVSKY